MYEQQFGLSRKPFRANAAGASVFVGPQTAKLMAGMKKALGAADAVVAVTGEPGVGKSTLVNRAIDAVAGDKQVIRVSRMQLGHDEVLEFLLEQLQAGELPAGTIKKINLFRDLLAQRTNAGTRVIVVIEDAVKIGEDALVEFESLSAADGSNSDGANIILMGDDSLLGILKAPALRRLQQRTRLRQALLPLAAGELQGYLKHCFRNAGAEFDLIFAAGAAQMIFDASQGNPRVANNLVESVLASASEHDADKVDNAVIARVANEEFGIAVDASSVAAATPEPEPKLEPEPEPRAEAPVEVLELIQDTLPDLEVIAPGLAAQGLDSSTEPEAAPEPAPQTAQTPVRDSEIPTLFDSTRLQAPQAIAPEPEAPEPVAAPKPAAPEPVTAPEPAAMPTPPEPVTPTAATAETPPPENKPAWDRDPTFAELRPDIEALEQAMADFQEPDVAVNEKEPEPDQKVSLKDPTLPAVPEITLDVAIEQKIHEAQEALEKTDGMIPADAAPERPAEEAKPEPSVGVPPLVNAPPPEPVVKSNEQADEQADKKADSQIERITAGLAAAKSIEDVDDQLAETLFGEEFSLIAAQVAAKAANSPDVEETEVAAGTPAGDQPDEQPDEQSGEQPGEQPDEQPDDEPQEENKFSAMEREFKEVYGDNAMEVSIETQTSGGLDLSASQRLATVRALNADKAPTVGLPPNYGAAANGPNTPATPAVTPEPIEDQITTSMTQTLKALSSRPPSSIIDDDEDDEEDKGGFFSRFKRS